jgi:hypothetical protein
MTAPTTSTCATCGQPITVTARHPYKRYCSPRCRVADWHRQHDRPHLPTTTNPGDGVPDSVPATPQPVVPDGTPHHDVPDRVPAATDSSNTDPTPYVANGDPRCPHCRAPIAIIAILVPPTAAHVRTPEVITTNQ